MKRPVIQAIGHVALQTPDLDACVATATQVMGLNESGRSDDGVFFSTGLTHHQLHYIEGATGALDHVGLEAPDLEALDDVRERLANAGVATFDPPADNHFADGVRFIAPGDFEFEVYVGMELDPTPRKQPGWYTEQNNVGVRPNRFGHITYRVPEPEPMMRFLKDILDFRISDAINGGYFVRCNVDHHGVGVMPGPGVMHHHAWEVQSMADLVRVGDRVHELGGHLLWGPVRHGVGNNLAAYFADGSGAVVEYYTDMQKIYNDAEYEQAPWADDWYSMWVQTRPEGFADYGLPPRALAESRSAA
jgi:catechol-2,3-dioxygenase